MKTTTVSEALLRRRLEAVCLGAAVDGGEVADGAENAEAQPHSKLFIRSCHLEQRAVRLW